MKDTCERSMISINEAYELVDDMRQRFYDELPRETIAIEKALERKVSKDIRSTASMPVHDISIVDGYAVNIDDDLPLKLKGDIYAGSEPGVLGKGESAYIATGAIVPKGANAVIKIEDSGISEGMLYGKKPGLWDNIVKEGSDFTKGEVVLLKDTVITPSVIGMLHAAGVKYVEAYKKPKAGIISTGDEIASGMIKNSNTPMIDALLKTWGCETTDLGTVPDSSDDIKRMIDDASGEFDIMITIGGVSVGKKDYVSAIIKEYGKVVFKGYKVRPGKPLLVSYYNDKPVFSLPGKPTASYTSMELIVKRFVKGTSKSREIELPVTNDIMLTDNNFDHVVYVTLDGESAVPLMNSKEIYDVSRVSSLTKSIVADGFFMTHDSLRAGQKVKISLMM